MLIQDMSDQPFNYGDSGNGGVVWIRTKYLYFDENVRPAYYGTHRSKSAVIGPRKPFAKDVQRLDYDYDSEAEWEEDDGESLSHSDVSFHLRRYVNSINLGTTVYNNKSLDI